MTVDLLDALGQIPALPGAACRGRSAMFDPPEADADPEYAQHRSQAALRLCGHCPALSACGAWFHSLPPKKRPHGVIAGRVNIPKPGRRPRRIA